MLDGDITSDDFRMMKTEIETALSRLRVEHRQASTDVTNIDEKLDHLSRTLSNLINLYRQGDTALKRKLIGSIFPNKLIFEKNSVRTIELNHAVALIVSKINASGRRKKEKHTDFGVLSHRVVPPGKPAPSKTRINAGFKNMETPKGDDFGYLKSNVFCCQMKERYTTKVLIS